MSDQTSTPSKGEFRGSGPEPEVLDHYLAEIRDTPVLERNQQIALAREMAEAEDELRREIVKIPETARQVVREWRSRLEKNLVSGAMNHGHRDGSGTDWSKRVDEDLRAVEASLALLEQARTDEATKDELEDIRQRLADQMTRANIALPKLIALAERLAEDSDPAETGGRALQDRILARVDESIARLTDSRNRFITHNLRLVIRCAKAYGGHGIPLADLIQEGNLGLIRAVEKFDYRKGFKFSTYAIWWIEQSLNRAVQADSRLIRVPGPILDLQRKMKQHETSVRLNRSAEPTEFEVAEAVVADDTEIDDLRRSLNAEISCESMVGDYEDLTVGERLTYDEEIDPVDEIDRSLLREQLLEALEGLPDRARYTLECRFGLVGGAPQTLATIGEEFGVSRERVRQIEKMSIGLLRDDERVQRLAKENSP